MHQILPCLSCQVKSTQMKHKLKSPPIGPTKSIFQNLALTKVSLSYHLCVECFSQLSFVSEMYTKLSAVADFVYTSESNESCEKHSTQR